VFPALIDDSAEIGFRSRNCLLQYNGLSMVHSCVLNVITFTVAGPFPLPTPMSPVLPFLVDDSRIRHDLFPGHLAWLVPLLIDW
jgi:hypothetical protein